MGKHLQLLEIAEILDRTLGSSIFAVSMRAAIAEGRVKDAVKEIFEQSKDNRPLVSRLVSEKALLKIEKYFA